MLRNRSRTVTTKQAVMGDKNQIQTSSKNTTTPPISSFLGSPRFFNGFFPSAANSPTSILDAKNSSNFANPFRYDDKNLSKPQIPSPPVISLTKPGTEEEAIGLALVLVSTNSEKADGKSSSRMVVFKEKLNIQIPSQADFGIKTRYYSQFAPNSSSTSTTPAAQDYFTGQLSLKEMEVLEDYTCVIIHGSNTKTTHIFDGCIVEIGCEDGKMETGFERNVSKSPPAATSFLNYCHTCKESLGAGKDIYIYRGEKAFCSHECRFQEMLFEGMKNPEMDGNAF